MSYDYEHGFAQGETTRFQDRKRNYCRARPPEMKNEHMRGFWDGYFPRSVEWLLQNPSTRCSQSWVDIDRSEVPA